MPPARFALILLVVIAAAALTVFVAAQVGPLAGGGAGLAVLIALALGARALLGMGR